MTPEDRELWVSLRDHFNALSAEREKRHNDLWTEREKRLSERWQAQDAAVHAAFAAAKEALVTATAELGKKLELLNELRGNVLQREEYDAKHETILTELAHVRSEIGQLHLQIAAQPEIRALERGQTKSAAEREGHVTTLRDVIAVAAVVVAVLAIIASVVVYAVTH